MSNQWFVEKRDKCNDDEEPKYEFYNSYDNEMEASQSARRLYKNGTYGVRVINSSTKKESMLWCKPEMESI